MQSLCNAIEVFFATFQIISVNYPELGFGKYCTVLLCLRFHCVFIFSGWYLEYVDIDAPSMGQKWHFPCGRWIDKDKDDGQLERDLYPAEEETVRYVAKIPYEITGNEKIFMNER